ncbi:3-phenylpropionate/cinnamic acid dioxygenase subunit beta [Bacillus sp. FJAT-45350]|uniref:3-phenylpropionate/cinnamic acid dioxygenase subunit beta n=1 Tax=Bacillus sp. FJAT-45350 TaxID=2011014 RepID=UPI000BB79FC9|nr:3-phenylpropionate/cinnamic acid dioxygenase subunit beta [Bacillus sp. FJAT-45350]
MNPQLQDEFVGYELQHKISMFLYQEAHLLDQRKYREWLNLLGEEIVYRMPLRVTTDNKRGENLLDDFCYYEETKASLTTRAERLYSKSAWVENPAPRQRHFISNIIAFPGDNSNEYKVRSYFLFKRSRAFESTIEELCGEREDIIRNENGEWKIISRTIIPDQAVLGVMNISMFL